MLAQKFYKKDDVPGILKITLELDPDYELNFVDNLEDMMLFRAFLQEQEIHKTLDYIRRNYQNKFTQHELDGALIEYYIRELKRHGDALINDVCCATTTAIYKNIKTYIPNGVEYCLRNDETIKTIEVE
ncbi:hypothetical protein FD30_GL000309 [Levilactobacillus namurensis DSM 19117]|uniref:Uncharacterized protein n=2 Tax=Levilactobacillus namurensis TaxID=380393 RepID=A0A0R1JYW4_9LACO|nr:hypothetical protein FD30_GL000309 [Levilactobacillus namurensis DSM 19117]